MQFGHFLGAGRNEIIVWFDAKPPVEFTPADVQRLLSEYAEMTRHNGTPVQLERQGAAERKPG